MEAKTMHVSPLCSLSSTRNIAKSSAPVKFSAASCPQHISIINRKMYLLIAARRPGRARAAEALMQASTGIGMGRVPCTRVESEARRGEARKRHGGNIRGPHGRPTLRAVAMIWQQAMRCDPNLAQEIESGHRQAGGSAATG